MYFLYIWEIVVDDIYYYDYGINIRVLIGFIKVFDGGKDCSGWYFDGIFEIFDI